MRKKLYMAMTAALLLTGCDKDVLDSAPIRLGGPSSLAGGSVAVYVEEDEPEGSPVTTHYVRAFRYDVDSVGLLYAAGGEWQYYPVNRKAVNVYAYHPWRSLDIVPPSGARDRSEAEVSFSVQDDQRTAASFRQSDLMYARREGVFPTGDIVPLDFRHLLCKVTLAFRTDGTSFREGQLEGAEVTVEGTKLKASLHFRDGELLAHDDMAYDYTYRDAVNAPRSLQVMTLTEQPRDREAGGYVSAGGSRQYGSAVLVPQPLKEGTVFLRVGLTGMGYITHRLKTALYLAPGKAYTFYCELTDKGINLVDTEVEEWRVEN